MDDQPLADPADQAPRRRGLGLGPAASLVVLGLVTGLAVGWVAWNRDGGMAEAGDVPGPPARTSPAGTTVVEGVDVTNDPSLGPDDAPVTIVEFSDFECPFCTRFARQTAPLLRRQYEGDVRFVFVNLPLRSIHPRAYEAALAGECAAEQGEFWAFYDAMFSERYGTSDAQLRAVARDLGLDTERFDQCLTNADYAAEVAADEKEAQKFYILGTPTFFINGKRMEGAQPAEAFAVVIDSILSSES